jgi:hypothetical protein
MRLLLAAVLASLCLTVAGAASAQPPGGFIGAPCFAVFEIGEGPAEVFANEHTGPLPLGCPVYGGYVVLLDSSDPSVRQNPIYWSDVAAFTNGGPVQPGQPTDAVYLISESANPSTGIEDGMHPSDLAVAGLTVADIVGNPTTVYIVEGSNTVPGATDRNIYDVVTPAGVAHYIFRSDPPEGPTPTLKDTWGRIKALYR